MGAFCKLIDTILFLYFLFLAIIVPLIDGQTCFPLHIFPNALVDLKHWYASEYGDYLVAEKPHFFVGVVWLEILFQWPLAIACVYGIASGKSWFNTTCVLYGASTLTSMAAILAELKWSGRASDKLLMVYIPFLCVAVLTLFRGLLPHSIKTTTIGKRPALNRKKRV